MKVRKLRQAGQKCDYIRDIRPKIMAKKSKTRNYRSKKHSKSRRFSLIVAGEMQKLKKLVKYAALGHQKPPMGGPQASKPHKNTSFSRHETTKSAVFFGLKWFQMKPFEASNGFKWREAEKSAKIDETLANSGGLKERKSMFIDPQRRYSQ